MSITGCHMLLHTTEAEALRTMLRDVFGLKFVDAGHGWLIFRMPPSELGIHPAEGAAAGGGGLHQISFMCDDIQATVAELRKKGVTFIGEPTKQGFGVAVTMALPGNVRVLLYEPRHPVAIDA